MTRFLVLGFGMACLILSVATAQIPSTVWKVGPHTFRSCHAWYEDHCSAWNDYVIPIRRPAMTLETSGE